MLLLQWRDSANVKIDYSLDFRCIRRASKKWNLQNYVISWQLHVLRKLQRTFKEKIHLIFFFSPVTFSFVELR